MALFKKKPQKEDSFSLPELPSFSEMQEIKDALRPEQHDSKELPTLPEFPSLPSIPGLDRDIGQITSQPKPFQAPPAQPVSRRQPALPPAEYTPSISYTSLQPSITMEEPAPAREMESPRRRAVPVAEPRSMVSESMPSSRTSSPGQKGPVFIKIDKFREAAANFDAIKRKITELDELLRKTKEVRDKEMQEFDEWEQELNELKGKVSKIDERLFSDLEY